MTDGRIAELVEVLISAGADWLAVEVLECLRIGRVSEETAEDLNVARQAVRSASSGPSQQQTKEENERPPPAATPFTADEQISLAEKYVANRLTDIVSMLEIASDDLNEILSSDHDSDGPVVLIHKADDEDLEINRQDINLAKNALPALRDALSKWTASIRAGELG